jgi:purine-binding chemotaxis protein CheW
MTSTRISADTEKQGDRQRCAQLPGKYLTFALGSEDYGLPVLRVREIIKLMDITAVPQAPLHVRGVINLRGKVIPVVDLRSTFGLGTEASTDRTCIIVVEVTLAVGSVLMGVVVDSVSEVLNITAEELEAPPPSIVSGAGPVIMALAKVKGRVKILLDVDRAVGSVGRENALDPPAN